MGIFIQITTDQRQLSPEISAQLVALCPVDIFALSGQQLQIRPEQEDECILCERCLDAAPAGALTIYKTYKAETLVSRGVNE